ncbi:MAG: 2-keto-4-pentenoate hydratase [Burkholderiales bacterium]
MDTRAIAQELLDALDHGRTVQSLVERHRGFGWDEAYSVAADLLALRQRRGEKPVGRKIGFTNRNIWPEYGATSPIWAHVYDRTLVFAGNHRATVSLGSAVRPRLEPEIAFRLKAALPAGIADPAQVLQYVEWFAPSFEIVDCHFADWKFGPADAAADFSLHWRLIIGEPCAVRAGDIRGLAVSLRECSVTLRRGETVMDRGTGANALDHPVTPLAFLADMLSRQPWFQPLAAGEIITTGTLTAALPIGSGETWSSEYAGLPLTGLQLSFTD